MHAWKQTLDNCDSDNSNNLDEDVIEDHVLKVEHERAQVMKNLTQNFAAQWQVLASLAAELKKSTFHLNASCVQRH